MNRELNWAILGSGWIAGDMADAFLDEGRKVYSVGSRTKEKVIEFAKKHNIDKVYDDYHEMFYDDNVDAVYIATPHNKHFEAIMEALENGKHVLCDKAITLNSSELNQAVLLAEKNNLVLAEAMTIYHMPLYKKLSEMVRAGVFGKVNLIHVYHGSFREHDMNSRFFSKSLAGGALLDIGVYALSFARLFMPCKPTGFSSGVQMVESGVDETEGILLMNGEDLAATLTVSLHARLPKRAFITCEKAYIELDDYQRPQTAQITYIDTEKTETVSAGRKDKALFYEIEDMEDAILGKGNDTYLNLTVDVMDIMTGLREDWGFKYPEEE